MTKKADNSYCFSELMPGDVHMGFDAGLNLEYLECFDVDVCRNLRI